MRSFTVLDATAAEAAAPMPCPAKDWLTGELTQEEHQIHTLSITAKTHLEILELRSVHGNMFRERK